MYVWKTNEHPPILSAKYRIHPNRKAKLYALALEKIEGTFTKKGHMIMQIPNLQNSVE